MGGMSQEPILWFQVEGKNSENMTVLSFYGTAGTWDVILPDLMGAAYTPSSVTLGL